MKEDELILTHHVGDVINILHQTTHHLFDPDELLTVIKFCQVFLFSSYSLLIINLHQFSFIHLFLQVAFDKIGSMTTGTISKQRKKQEPAVMAELHQRLRRLNSLKLD